MEQLVLKPCIRKLGAVALTLALFGLVYGAEASSLSVKEQQDLFAYEVFIDFWNVQPSSWRNEYSEIQHLQSARELAIQDLDRSKSRLAHRALAYLSLLGLDGGVSEVHGCAVYSKGKPMLPYLEEARRAYAAGKCVLPESNRKLTAGRCGDAKTVKIKLDRLVAVIEAGNRCE